MLALQLFTVVGVCSAEHPDRLRNRILRDLGCPRAASRAVTNTSKELLDGKAHELVTISCLDRGGRRDGKEVTYASLIAKHTTPLFRVASYEYRNGVRVGHGKRWNTSGKVVLSEKFDDDGLRHGLFERHDSKGRLLASGEHIRGLKSGPWSTATGGKKVVEGHFQDGLPDGAWQYHWSGGQSRASGAWSQGKRIGTWNGWYEDGRDAFIIKYDLNGRVSSIVCFSPQGRPVPPEPHTNFGWDCPATSEAPASSKTRGARKPPSTVPTKLPQPSPVPTNDACDTQVTGECQNYWVEQALALYKEAYLTPVLRMEDTERLVAQLEKYCPSSRESCLLGWSLAQLTDVPRPGAFRRAVTWLGIVDPAPPAVESMGWNLLRTACEDHLDARSCEIMILRALDREDAIDATGYSKLACDAAIPSPYGCRQWAMHLDKQGQAQTAASYLEKGCGLQPKATCGFERPVPELGLGCVLEDAQQCFAWASAVPGRMGRACELGNAQACVSRARSLQTRQPDRAAHLLARACLWYSYYKACPTLQKLLSDDPERADRIGLWGDANHAFTTHAKCFASVPEPGACRKAAEDYYQSDRYSPFRMRAIRRSCDSTDVKHCQFLSQAQARSQGPN